MSLFKNCAGSGAMYDERVQIRVGNTERVSCHVCGKAVKLRPYAFGDGYQLPTHKPAVKGAA